MAKDKPYYLTWLTHLENEQLELVGLVLKIELLLYDNKRLILDAKEMGEYENPLLANSIFLEIRMKNLLKHYLEELDNIELDITHAKFMIDQIND